MSYQPQKEDLVEVLEDLESTDLQDLIVYNDDYNTFDHVTNTLIKVCKHDKLQAEGSLPELKPMKEAILEAGINAEIL